MLSGAEIREEIEDGRIVIDPPPGDLTRLGVSLDFTLSTTFWVYTLPLGVPGITTVADTEIFDPYDVLESQTADAITLEPNQYILGETQESLTLPLDICGWIEGKSGRARQGLTVHLTAPKIDPGWGQSAPKPITLEIVNHFPIAQTLRAKMPIAQMVFHRLAVPAVPYEGKHAHKGST